MGRKGEWKGTRARRKNMQEALRWEGGWPLLGRAGEQGQQDLSPPPPQAEVREEELEK